MAFSISVAAQELLSNTFQVSVQRRDRLRHALVQLENDIGTAREVNERFDADRLTALEGQVTRTSAKLETLLRAPAFSNSVLLSPSEVANAIGLLRAGDTFLLRPGLYEGPLKVPSGVTVVGSDRDTVHIRSNLESPDVVYLCPGATLIGVTVTQMSATGVCVRSCPGDMDCRISNCVLSSTNCCCIVSEGNLSLEHCDLTGDFDVLRIVERQILSVDDCRISSRKLSTTSAGVAAGAGSTLHISSSTIVGAGAGVKLSGDARASIRSTCIQGAKALGVEARECSQVRITDSVICDVAGNGAYIEANSIHVSNCRIDSCGKSGLVVSPTERSDSVHIRDCQFQRNQQIGLVVRLPASWDETDLRAQTKNNEFTANGLGDRKFEVV